MDENFTIERIETISARIHDDADESMKNFTICDLEVNSLASVPKGSPASDHLTKFANFLNEDDGAG